MRRFGTKIYRRQIAFGGKDNYRRHVFANHYSAPKNLVAIAVILILVIVAICVAFGIEDCFGLIHTFAAPPNANATDDLKTSVDEILKTIDFDKFEGVLDNLDDELGLVGTSFFERVKQLINDGYVNSDNLWHGISRVLFSSILKSLPSFALIIVICVLGNMLQGLNARKETSSVIYYATFSGVLVVVTVMVAMVVKSVGGAVTSMQKQMNITFPVLLSLITALGGTSTAAVYQPLMALLAQGISSLMTFFLIPMFVAGFIIQILSSFNPNLKIAKLSDMFSSLSKWLIGLVLAVFCAFLSVQGIYAGLHDGVSFRTAKYALSHYVPIVGGYLSEGLNMILAGSMLIKNAIGLCSILVIFSTILSPVLAILGLKVVTLVAGSVLEPLQNPGYSKFLSSVSKSMNLLLAIILSVAFMYLISLVLMISSANYCVS